MCIQVVQLCLFILALLASPICLYLLFFYAFIRWDLPTIFVICNIRFIRKPYIYLIYATNYCCYFWTGFEQARTMSIISCPLNAQLLCKPAVAPVDDPEGTCKWSAPLCFVFAPQLSSLFLHVMSPGPEWPPSPSSGLFKPCFILTTVADALVPVLVVFLLHSFIVVLLCVASFCVFSFAVSFEARLVSDDQKSSCFSHFTIVCLRSDIRCVSVTLFYQITLVV